MNVLDAEFDLHFMVQWLWQFLHQC